MEGEQTGHDRPSPVVSVLDSIQYQDGAVVSRILMKTPAGSMTLFAFDALQAISEHTTPHEALIQVVDGEAEVTIAGIRHAVGPGEMLILPANQPHAVTAVSKFKMILTMLRS